MENQKETLQDVTANPATIPVEVKPAKRPEAYTNRIRKMSDKALKSEVQRQGKAEMRRSNYQGVILATVLNVFMEGHLKDRAPYLR